MPLIKSPEVSEFNILLLSSSYIKEELSEIFKEAPEEILLFLDNFSAILNPFVVAFFNFKLTVLGLPFSFANNLVVTFSKLTLELLEELPK
ncbi:hypothetical protein OVS_01800 [Mycoplasma ovis str. Michigan]|uniref:Uncharacterized protein n=1 Tax=Mycoplasma ovis str. Michigan TaxID=1415773 RepID=A0ABM5P1D7_9MOLU|nr:hypothetical protein [Mycoplasma ovis]AHC40245.1 hypothetical protein OVS_01800 [Mycoplasma ovis str. Michigan]